MTGTTTEDRLHSVGDAGAYVPYARKHTERARQKTDASLRLSDLWPKPDWSKWITAERSVDVVSHLAMYYEGLRTSPHGDGVFGVSGSEWDKAYRLGVTSMIRLFSATKAEADLQTLGERYCVLLGLSKENLHKDVRLNAAYWSLGRGSGRKISSPFAQTLRSYSLSKWLPKMGWRGGECGLLKVCIVPVMMNDGRWRVAHIEGEHYCFLEVGEVKDEGHAVELAQERIKKSLDRTGTRRAVKEDLRRVGPIARQGNRNISSETLIEAFGLRAIQFGNVLSGGSPPIIKLDVILPAEV